MRIVNREEFLKLPPHTLYAKYDPDKGFSETQIKQETIYKDEVNQAEPFNWYLLEVTDAAEMQLRNEDSEWLLNQGHEVPLEFEVSDRDNLYDPDQLFAIYSNEDIQRLVDQLELCIKP